MNASIIYKADVNGNVLDELARELPAIIADEVGVPGGNVAVIKPERVSLGFSQANPRDVGPDIRIMIFAKNNDPRKSTEHARAKGILDKVLALITGSGETYSVNIRMYLMEIGVAEHALNI